MAIIIIWTISGMLLIEPLVTSQSEKIQENA